jgi:hypothetical protein
LSEKETLPFSKQQHGFQNCIISTDPTRKGKVYYETWSFIGHGFSGFSMHQHRGTEANLNCQEIATHQEETFAGTGNSSGGRLNILNQLFS